MLCYFRNLGVVNTFNLEIPRANFGKATPLYIQNVNSVCDLNFFKPPKIYKTQVLNLSSPAYRWFNFVYPDIDVNIYSSILTRLGSFIIGVFC